MESIFNNKKGENMTTDQLIQEALKRPENYNADGSVNGCFIDADINMDNDGTYTSKELFEALENYDFGNLEVTN